MPDDFGLSFSPTDDKNGGQFESRDTGGGASPIQDAIRVLSLRIPRLGMGGGVAPQPLLDSPGQAGFPMGGGGMPPNVEMFLKLLFGQMPGGSGFQPSAPMPAGQTLPPPKVGVGVNAPAGGGQVPGLPTGGTPPAPPQIPGAGLEPQTQEPPLGQLNTNTMWDRINRGGITGNRFSGR